MPGRLPHSTSSQDAPLWAAAKGGGVPERQPGCLLALIYTTADAPHWLTRHACRARQAEQAASIPLVQRLLADIPMWKPTLFFHEGDISYARCGALAVAVCTSCAGRGAVCGSL